MRIDDKPLLTSGASRTWEIAEAAAPQIKREGEQTSEKAEPSKAKVKQTYAVPSGFSYGQGVVGMSSVEDPAQALKAISSSFGRTLRDIARPDAAPSWPGNPQRDQALAKSMNQLMPMLENAARGVVDGINERFGKPEGGWTEEGVTALDGLLEQLRALQKRAKDLQGRLGEESGLDDVLNRFDGLLGDVSQGVGNPPTHDIEV